MIDCYCLWCGKSLRRESSLKHMFYVDDVICKSCRDKISYRPKRIKLDDITVDSLFVYEGLIREMIIQYKELSDEALFPVFLYPFIDELRRKYRGYTIVHVPSSTTNNKKRGFKAVNKMFGVLNLREEEMFRKKDDFDQKEVDFKRRHEIRNHLIYEPVKVKNNKVLLVDDILTTGETIKAAYSFLAASGYKIKVLTACYNRRFL